jgi:hypothetical protein
MDVPEVAHGELTVEGVDDVAESGGGARGENYVVNIEEKVGGGCGGTEDEEGVVAFRGDKTNGVKEVGEAEKPSAGRLFETVKGFFEATNVVGVGGVEETRRLGAVDGLSELTVEEGIFDIKLMNGPLFGSGNAEDDANGGWFDNGTEGFTVIHTSLLSEATQYPSSLVAC